MPSSLQVVENNGATYQSRTDDLSITNRMRLEN